MSNTATERNSADRPTPEWTRAAWIGELARADAGALAALWDAYRLLAPPPSYETLRPAEIGLVMTRGRIGGEGAPFNLGEVAATRCAVRIAGAEGPIDGHACALGRDKRKAETSAVIDALMQTDAGAPLIGAVLQPLKDARLAAERSRARKAAATRVEFFTLVRGED